MPKLNVKTLESKVGWTNPENADMVSYDVVIDVNGRKAQARTYSKAIAEVGFEGEVETYEKKDHTYLKQVQKEGAWNNGQRRFNRDKLAYKDNSDGQRQGMCINNAANYVNANEKDLTPVAWAEQVWRYANALYNFGDLKKEDVTEALDTGTLDEIADVPDDGRISLEDIEDVFGGSK